MSSISPSLHGDIKMGQDQFLTRPVTAEDLHESRAARNFWLEIEGYAPWSATGNSARQIGRRYHPQEKEPVTMEGGFLWHKTCRDHLESGLNATITNFIPEEDDWVELMKVTLENKSSAPLSVKGTFAVPIYGRSGDNIRDHRHVTSLLNQITVQAQGVVLAPSLSFNEAGHTQNIYHYAVLGCGEDGTLPAQIYPILEEFLGEGGTLDWPAAIAAGIKSRHQPGDVLEGYEALGGLQFPAITLAPGASFSYLIVLGIFRPPQEAAVYLKKYGSLEGFDSALGKTSAAWNQKLDAVRVQTADKRFDSWMRWVSIQPIFRYLYGNSFLPYHDYGRGGRGWRDLWQDSLGLLLMEPDDIGEKLISHFAGVRFDGSNATIIGRDPGDFKADRNNIPRVWMDHGAWPLLTTRMYLDWTGNLDLLLEQQTYFKDHLTHRSQKVDPDWNDDQGTALQSRDGNLYQGSIFEHLLVQNLIPFFNVGEHNCIRLEGADWNDALDMASERGESVAFSALYAGNLNTLAELAEQLIAAGQEDLVLAQELLLLLDSLGDKIDYSDPIAKQARLQDFFNSCARSISGNQAALPLRQIAEDLRQKSASLINTIQNQEWIQHGEYGWFNGYYDNHSRQLEGVFDNNVQITLTGQVFPLMAGVAEPHQAQQIIRSVEKFLSDPALQGIRLNSKFSHRTDALGRIFSFAYGHKENGALFSHMSVMYAYALYNQGFDRDGYQILKGLYNHCQDFPVSRIYPGLPEYLNPKGRGMYPYLTGSASWYLLTLITKIFGISGHSGDLKIRPAIDVSLFDDQNQAQIQIQFAARKLKIQFSNPNRLECGSYLPVAVEINGIKVDVEHSDQGLVIPRSEIQKLPAQEWQMVHVYLAEHKP